MLSLMAVVQKELLVLLRDRAGLLVLFVMPAVLVVVITLVQENVLKTMGAGDTEILLINQDDGALGRRMTDALAAAQGVRVVRQVDGRTPTRAEALALVADGVYQLCLIIPPGMSNAVATRARLSVQASLSGKRAADLPDTVPAPRIEIHFDPTVMGGYRSAVHHLMELTVLRIEVAEIFKALSGQLSGASQRPLTSPTPPLAGPWPSSPAFNFQADSPAMPLLRVEDGDAAAGQRPRLPTAVQQNVPAWSLFGIFFIVLPISGAFIQERVDGTRQRLAAMPVGYATLVGGRIIAYAGICGIQCILIGCIGKWLLPLWGSPALEMGHAPLALFTLLAGAILAATGFGILLGSVVDSYQQAAVIGPISVVIAAALGGIMVPVYAMPTFMQKISVISPLGWGLTGVIDVFVRGGRIGDVLPETAALVAFFIGCIIVAGMWQRRARTGGRLR